MGCFVLLSGCLTKPNPDWSAGATEGESTSSMAPSGSSSSDPTGPTAGTTSGIETAEGGSQGTGTTGGMPTDTTSTTGEPTEGSTGEPLVCGDQGQDCFGPPITVEVTPDEPRAAWVGDLDGDGHGDVVLTYTGSHQVQLLRGDGAGAFVADEPVGIGGIQPFDVHVVDVDDVGPPEILTANLATDNITLLRLDGVLEQVSSHEAGNGPYALGSGHFDDDGILDFAMALQLADEVSLIPGEGGLNVGSMNTFEFGNSPEGITVADLDQDGIDDVVAACDGGGGGVVIRLGESGGFGTDPLVLAPGGHFIDVAAVDIDLDGNVDIAAITHEDSILHVWWGDGSGGVEEDNPVMLLLAAGNGTPTRLAAGDINADAYVDFVVARVGTNDLSLIRSTPGRGFTGAKSLPASGPPWDVALGELNDDPFLDIVVTLPGLDAFDVFLTHP